MQIRECSASARQGAQKLESEISQENVSPPNKSAIEVTGSSSQQEADTAALRKKAPRSKKTKYPPIDKTASTAARGRNCLSNLSIRSFRMPLLCKWPTPVRQTAQ
jgi:hypothetical protein